MAEFYINTEAVARQSSGISEVANSIKNVQGKVSNVKNGLAGIGLLGVAPAITALEARLARHVGKTNQLSSVLGNSVLKYIAAESQIMGIPVFMNPDYQEVAGTVAQNAIDALDDLFPSTGFFSIGNAGSFSYESEAASSLFPFLQHHTLSDW